MKKIIVFDLDNTLAKSKMPLERSMANSLCELLEKFNVAIISGGNWEQFQKQVIDQMRLDQELFTKLHLFPTCGTQYFRFINNEWVRVYVEGMSNEDIAKIINALETIIQEFKINDLPCFGERIENRANSQVTFSCLGQQAPLELKSNFDPDKSKRLKMRELLLELIPEFSVRIGGTSSIDITKPGIDKSYGINKIIEQLNLKPEDILFVGDELSEFGNDYPVKAMGIDTIQTTGPENTIQIIQKILETY